MMRKILPYLQTGLAIGFVATAISMMVIQGVNDVTKQILVWMAASAIFGLVSMIFMNDRISLPLATLIHFVVCASVAIGAGALLGYADSLWSLIAGVMPVFLVIYLVVSVVIYLSIWLNARALNRRLKENREEPRS